MSIVGPIALYSNVPIHPEYYQPRDFFISDISMGVTTVVTTSDNHDFVIGQLIKLIIPVLYGAHQLNGQSGYVISVPSATQVTVNINSSGYNSFVISPITSTITAISKASYAVVTASNSYVPGNVVLIEDVVGMTQLNDNYYKVISATASAFSINVNSTTFSTYISGGTATLYTTQTTKPQIIPVGDVNSGVTSNSDINALTTYISGSFINIS